MIDATFGIVARRFRSLSSRCKTPRLARKLNPGAGFATNYAVADTAVIRYASKKMSDFVGYHKTDEWGPYFEKARQNHASSLDFFTAKPYRPETLIGGRLWVFTGRGSPRIYELVCSGTINGIAPAEAPAQSDGSSRAKGANIAFDVDYFPEPIDVSGASWFQQLLAEQQNFRHGLSRISDERVVAELTKLRTEGR